LRRPSILEWILIGFVLGIAAGAVIGPPVAVIKPLGTVFVRLLKMLVIPLIFSTLTVGVSGLAGGKLGRMLGKTFFFYYFTGICALVIGLTLAGLTGVGTGMELGKLKGIEVKEAPPFTEVLLNIVPTNPVKALAQGEILQIIFFSILFGMAISAAGRSAEPVRKVLEALAETMYKLVNYVLYYAPIGVFALISWTVGTYGLRVLKPFAYLILLVYAGCGVQIFLVYGGLLRMMKIRPLRYLNRIKAAPLFGFSTCSSSATLPVTMRVVQNAGVSSTTTSFVLPMGATINMDGTAIYQAVTVVFLANAFGIQLTAGQMVTVGVTALLASIGTAGVPGAGLIMLAMVLGSVGIPLEGIAFIAGIDRILDMARTAVNVVDDSVAAALVAVTEGETLPPALRV